MKSASKAQSFNKAKFLHTIHPAWYSLVSKEIQTAYEIFLLGVRKEHVYDCSSEKLIWSI